MPVFLGLRHRSITSPSASPELKRVFLNFALDIGWYGVLNGSILTFISIYITRLGGSALQVGMINALPAVVTLLLALPAGQWLSTRQVSWNVFISSVLSRLFYLTLVIIPFIFKPSQQITLIILAILLMTIPGTITNVGFTALLGEGTPPSWRGYLSGVRNSLFAIINVLTLLLCGWILGNVAFPTGYQIVFALGALGAGMSSLHLFLLHHTLHPSHRKTPIRFTQVSMPVSLKGVGKWLNPVIKKISLLWNLRLDILRGPFWITFVLMFTFHFVQFFGIPIFPVYSVNELNLSDQVIGIGQAMFYITVFLGSSQISRLTEKLGNKRLFGFGVCAFGLFPTLLIFSDNLGMYLVTNAVGGLVWALIGGAIYNYVLDKAPDEGRPVYIAWYMIAMNSGMLVGSLGGPWLTGILGMVSVLVICAIFRFLSGVAILRWG
ncbi:MAG: MFS transporter [Anaerolineaceae bacterium]|nr:MFS transporter [Anaerolineaceae bacterium]MBN2676742.1 MFS transporter [Anaerolineaceae bacterium]